MSWNCNGALRKKTDRLDALEADALIIQECENPAGSTIAFRKWAGEYNWIGNNKNRGLGVFSRTGIRIQRLNWSGTFEVTGFRTAGAPPTWRTEDLELFLPLRLNDTFNLLAVWTKGGDAFGYIGQLWRYLQIHHHEVASDDIAIIGDLNSNVIWDNADRWWNHSDVIRDLAGIGVHSLYHAQHNEHQGKESTPTFFLHRNINKAYHIDYAFMSKMLLQRAQLNIGSPDEWLDVSDHMPLVVELADT